MRVLAYIPALLALKGAVTAAPVTAAPVAAEPWPPAITGPMPSEAELKAILAKGLNVTEQTLPIPASEILAPGAADDIFAQSSPRDANNPLLAKRLYDRGFCYDWDWWVDGNTRQGYYNDFQYAKAVFQSFNRFDQNWIGPMQYWTWDWYSFKLTIRNQDQCNWGAFTWDDILDMMDDLWYHYCLNIGQGWGYMSHYPTVVANIHYSPLALPGFQPECNHTGLKKLVKAKREVE